MLSENLTDVCRLKRLNKDVVLVPIEPTGVNHLASGYRSYDQIPFPFLSYYVPELYL